MQVVFALIYVLLSFKCGVYWLKMYTHQQVSNIENVITFHFLFGSIIC